MVLNLVFKSLPEPIKNWLTSNEIKEKLAGIIIKFNLKEEQELALSKIILRLVTQDLKPENLTSEISSDLSVDEIAAKNIIESVNEKILGPIADDLLTTGVDTKLLKFNIPSSAPPIAPTPLRSPVQNKLQDKPFVLHEEKNIESATEASAIKPSFIFKGSPNISLKNPETTKVTIERVVHYSNFYTPLNRSPLKYYQKVKIPKSKWFV